MTKHTNTHTKSSQASLESNSIGVELNRARCSFELFMSLCSLNSLYSLTGDFFNLFSFFLIGYLNFVFYGLKLNTVKNTILAENSKIQIYKTME